MTKGKTTKSFLLLIIFSFCCLKAQVKVVEAFPAIIFNSPVDIQNAGDSSNRLFIVEQSGVIKVFNNSKTGTFLDITNRVVSGGEMGLLGLAFHPDFKENGYFYVNYTTPSPLRTRISRFKVSSNYNEADSSSETILLTFNQPFQNHNGGQLSFGPDGYLYISTGDGGSAGDPMNYAQNINSLLGKILRIDVDKTQDTLNYSIPFDNPFAGIDSARKEIFAYGFRNPWRFSFDNYGKLWAADVGQDKWEEIDTITSGGNYGWKILEGSHCYLSSTCNDSGLIPPVFEYPHNTTGGFSITGGYVYNGLAAPYLSGKYVFADYVSGKIWVLNPDSNSVEFISNSEEGITSFGVDEQNELYFCSSGGKTYKFISTSTNISSETVKSPGDYKLNQNYPNPFNPSTNISYYIPELSSVRIDIINNTGELVSVLENNIRQHGYYNLNWNASGLSSGIYFARMESISLLNGKSSMNVIKTLLIK